MRTSKVCTICKKDLLASEYTIFKHPNGRDYLQSQCKPCRSKSETARYKSNPRKRERKLRVGREYRSIQYQNQVNRYQTDPEYRDYVKDAKQKIIERNRNYVHEYLKTHPCEACKESDIVVLEFDHIDKERKTENIARMISNSCLERLIVEMAKCRVLCANCHKRHTAKQFNWKKASL